MPTITRRLEFDAGHRVLGHEGPCKNLHGHRYLAEITVISEKLDNLGRVVDFGVIKKLVGDWISSYWDHNVLLNKDDPIRRFDLKQERFPYTIPNGLNPTAEVMAEILYNVCCNLFVDTPIKMKSVRLYETPNCWADYPDE